MVAYIVGIYQSALGAEFEKLGQALKKFHDGSNTSLGELTVTHSKRLIPKFFIWLMNLPREGVKLETHLEVTQTENSEVWNRRIGTTRLITRQQLRNGKLVEQAGPMQMEFDLSESHGAMIFHSYRSRILGIALPDRIAPFIHASATPSEQGWDVLVEIQCPRYGTICCYQGEMRTT